MNSAIYMCKIMHNRLHPVSNYFVYKMFTFLIDLDELEQLDQKYRWLSVESFNLFSFYRKDHMNYGYEHLKQAIINQARQDGCQQEISKVYLLTNLRVLGYVFNPVSIYYLFDKQDEMVGVLAEVNNTFGEQKPYFISQQNRDVQETFRKKEQKLFYVSPFFSLETYFDFRIPRPAEKLKLQINVHDEKKKLMAASYTGVKKAITNKRLLKYFFAYPLVTIWVVYLIHYQALKLMIKKIPFIRKMENLHLQQGVYDGKID